MLSAFLARIGRKYPDIELHISSGSTNDIIRGLENGQINLGFIRPVEIISLLQFSKRATGADALDALTKVSACEQID